MYEVGLDYKLSLSKPKMDNIQDAAYAGNLSALQDAIRSGQDVNGVAEVS